MPHRRSAFTHATDATERFREYPPLSSARKQRDAHLHHATTRAQAFADHATPRNRFDDNYATTGSRPSHAREFFDALRQRVAGAEQRRAAGQ